MTQNPIQAKVSGKNVVIKIPIDLLENAFNYKDDNVEFYAVKYKQKFAQGFVDYILNGTSEMNSETGLTEFQTLFDQIFDEMICSDEPYIKSLEKEEY